MLLRKETMTLAFPRGTESENDRDFIGSQQMKQKERNHENSIFTWSGTNGE